MVTVRTETVRISVFERLIGALPVPYTVSAALFATLLGPPGTVGLGLVATQTWSATVELYFGGQPPGATWQQVVAVIAWWVTYYVLFQAVRWERLAVARERASLQGVTPPDYHPVFLTKNLTAFWPAAFLAVILGVVSWPFIGAVISGLEGGQHQGIRLIWLAQNSVRLGLFFMALGTLLWLSLAVLVGLTELGNQELQLRPLEEDGLLGLRAAGSMALVVASTYFGVASLLAAQLVLAPAIPAFGATLAVSLAFGITLFFAPLWEFHRKMKAAKDRRQADVRSRLLRLAFPAQSGPGHGEDQHEIRQVEGLVGVRESLDRATEVLTLEAARRELDGSSTWPFDLTILRRLGAVMLPILVALLTELVRLALGL